MCVKGVRELDSEVWQEKRSAGESCHTDISVLLYLALFSLLFYFATYNATAALQ